MRVGQALRAFVGRRDSGAGSSRFLVKEARMAQDFRISFLRNESGAGTSGFFLDVVRMVQALRNFWWKK